MALLVSSLARRRLLCRSVVRCLSTTAGSHHDIAIVGGGIVGTALANLLQKHCPRYRVAVLEATKGPSAASSDVPHPRSYALSPASLELIGATVIEKLGELGYYDSMQIWEQDSPAMLVFSQHDLPQAGDNLGACVEHDVLLRGLWNVMEPNTTVYTGQSIQSLDIQEDKVVELTSISSESKEATKITADLVVAADGASSRIRSMLGIPWKGLDYGRTAVTFTVELSKPLPPRAFQRFLPNGPIALLPTKSKQHAVVVWSMTPQEALVMQKTMSEADLVQLLNKTLQQGPQRLQQPLFPSPPPLFQNLHYGIERAVETLHYGLGMRHWSDDPEIFMAPPLVAKIASPKFCFPLSAKMASSFASGPVALVGDAAHTVHPMAGQGLNLGLDDVHALVKALRKSHDSGMQVTQFVEDEYQSNRSKVVPAVVGGIHLLHQIFSSQNLMHTKSLGMSLLNQATPIRQQLAKVATQGL